MAGKLISVEGIDYAGKTTQVSLLRQALENQLHSVFAFKFPDDRTEVGRLLKRVLRGTASMPVHAVFALFAVNRLERNPAIQAARLSHRAVLFDRYSESEYAYGGASGLPQHWLMALEQQVPPADLVIVLDIDPLLALRRAAPGAGLDTFEQDVGFLLKVRQEYLRLACRPPRRGQRWEVIDGGGTIQEVHKTLTKQVMEVL